MLAQFYSPIIGGTERHVQALGAELVKRGHEVAVATLWHKGLPRFELDQGVRVYRVQGLAQRLAFLYTETGRRHTPPFPDPGVVSALRTILARERPDIVHAHNWLVHSFLPLKGWARAELVMTLHDFSLVCSQMRFVHRGIICDGPGWPKCLNCAVNHYGMAKGIVTALGNWLMSRVARTKVDMFLPVSQAVAVGTGLEQNGDSFRVIPNFVPDNGDITRDDPDFYAAQLPDSDYLLYVGDLARDKGIDVLLETYRSLTDVPPLVLIGRRCADTPTTFPDGVVVFNNWPHHAVLRAWGRTAIALVPSLCPDACPTVVIEAMAAGKPVIGSLIGGIPDLIINQETGFLVQPGEPAALKQAIICLLSSPDLRARMGQAARVRSAEFKASCVVPKIEQVYRELCSA